MSRKQAIAGAARHVALVALVTFFIVFTLFTPLIGQAAGGTLQFRGAVIESACAISAAHAGFSQAMLQRLGVARGSVDGGAMHVSMRCNGDQSVALSFESKASVDGDAARGNVVLRRVGRDMHPEETISLALPAKKERGIEIQTALRKAAAGSAADGGTDGAVLVSVSYR